MNSSGKLIVDLRDLAERNRKITQQYLSICRSLGSEDRVRYFVENQVQVFTRFKEELNSVLNHLGINHRETATPEPDTVAFNRVTELAEQRLLNSIKAEFENTIKCYQKILDIRPLPISVENKVLQHLQVLEEKLERLKQIKEY